VGWRGDQPNSDDAHQSKNRSANKEAAQAGTAERTPLKHLKNIEGAARCARLATVYNRRMLRKTLQRRFEHLMTVLAEQVESLPMDNESWLETEREITAVERALQRLPLCDA
jgi:hypothetical protein